MWKAKYERKYQKEKKKSGPEAWRRNLKMRDIWRREGKSEKEGCNRRSEKKTLSWPVKETKKRAEREEKKAKKEKYLDRRNRSRRKLKSMKEERGKVWEAWKAGGKPKIISQRNILKKKKKRGVKLLKPCISREEECEEKKSEKMRKYEEKKWYENTRSR